MLRSTSKGTDVEEILVMALDIGIWILSAGFGRSVGIHARKSSKMFVFICIFEADYHVFCGKCRWIRYSH